MSTVHSSLSLLSRLSLLCGYIWEREKLGKWKVSKGAKSGKEKSQETGTVRERGKSGTRQRQQTGKVRKSLRIRCRHRNPCVQCTLVYPSCPVYPSDAVIWKGEKSAEGTSQGTGKVRKGESQERGKAKKWEGYEPHIHDLSRIFVTSLLTFELTPPAHGAQFAPQLWTFPDCS